MDFTEIIGVVDVIVVLAVMVSAAANDVRTREVSDRHWQVLAVVGPVMYFLFCTSSEGFRWEYAVNTLGMLSAACCFTIGEAKQDIILGAVSAVCLAIVLVLGGKDALAVSGMVAQAMVFVCFVLYLSGILRGGADAKCLMVLSVSLPIYYIIWHFPLIGCPDTVAEIIVPSLSVLFVGAVGSAVWCIMWYLLRGGSRTMRIDEAEKRFVWPAEDIVDGEKVYVGTCDDEEMPAVYARLRAHGEYEVRISYMIPMIAPLAVATVLTVVLGNPLFLIL